MDSFPGVSEWIMNVFGGNRNAFWWDRKIFWCGYLRLDLIGSRVGCWPRWMGENVKTPHNVVICSLFLPGLQLPIALVGFCPGPWPWPCLSAFLLFITINSNTLVYCIWFSIPDMLNPSNLPSCPPARQKPVFDTLIVETKSWHSFFYYIAKINFWDQPWRYSFFIHFNEYSV